MYKDSLVSLQQLDEVRMKLEMAAQVASLNAKRKEVSHSARIEQIDQAKGQLDGLLVRRSALESEKYFEHD
jgi:HlyD family secretion protein